MLLKGNDVEWISVKDRLPDSEMPVIVPGGLAVYRNGTWFTGMEEPLYKRPMQWDVTHWIPLPDKPQTEKESE